MYRKKLKILRMTYEVRFLIGKRDFVEQLKLLNENIFVRYKNVINVMVLKAHYSSI